MKENTKKEELYIRLLFLLENYLNSVEDKDNYFYQINLINFLHLNNIYKYISEDEKYFLMIFYDNELTLEQKIAILKMNDKNMYYYEYKKIIKKLVEEVKESGIL